MKVLLYEVKKSANNNFEKLFKDKYFYWNPNGFKKLGNDDKIFVINRYYKKDNYPNGIVFLCEIINKNILVKNGNNVIDKETGLNETIEKEWKSPFYKFKVISSRSIHEEIENKWISLGSSETTYLLDDEKKNKKSLGNKEIKKIENNLKRIKFLKKIFKDDENALAILKKTEDFLNSKNNNIASNSNNNIQSEKKTEENNMEEIINKIFIAIKTKPFVILAGLSGTGKSRLVRTLAYKTCPEELRNNNKPGNFELIPVKPNWHDSTELLGYITRINGEKYVPTKFLKFLAKAWKNPNAPFFLLLDEMNLAPVEHYFAEYLSIIETRRKENNKIVTDFIISKEEIGEKLYNQLLEDLELNNENYCKEGISIPENFIVIGTVNMDETTHSFSRKVLDRAMTFEISDVNLDTGLDKSINDWTFPQQILDFKKVKSEFTQGSEVYKQNDFNEKEKKDILKKLEEINEKLKDTPFLITYRVRDEILIYCYHAKKYYNDQDWIYKALDDIILMKVLPKIEGDESKVKNAIENLIDFFDCENNESQYNKVCKKLKEMKRMLDNFGYTSFWK